MVNVHLVATRRNKSDLLHWNLASVTGQIYPKLRISYVDDASDPNDRAELERLAKTLRPLGERVDYSYNTQRQGVIKNILTALRDTPDEDVVVLLDGDDSLAHPRAIERIAQEYEDPECWLTYGSFLAWPEFRVVYDGAYDRECIRENLFRKWFWRCAPPRSFRMGLLRRVPPGYHLDDDQTHWELANDQGLILPMLELAGQHIRHIPDVLYLYDLWNWRNPSTRQAAALADSVERIRSRPTLQPLHQRPW